VHPGGSQIGIPLPNPFLTEHWLKFIDILFASVFLPIHGPVVSSYKGLNDMRIYQMASFNNIRFLK
jgi:hypothetical protein